MNISLDTTNSAEIPSGDKNSGQDFWTIYKYVSERWIICESSCKD